MDKLKIKDVRNLDGLAYIITEIDKLGKYSQKFFHGEYLKKSIYTPSDSITEWDTIMHNYNCAYERTLKFDRLPTYKKFFKYWGI